MSQQTSADPQRQGNPVLDPLRTRYVPTEEESRVIKECNQESFFYRSLPLSVVGMALTQLFISRGVITASGRYGSLPKLAFAGICGYFGGKISYMKTCMQRLKNLENSPLGEALRQQELSQKSRFTQEQSELSDPNKTDYEPAFQLDDQKNQASSYARDFTYSDNMTSTNHSDTQMREPDIGEEDVKKKHLLYEDLRLKNRENYEVTMTKKAETVLKPSAETSPAKRGKTNKYGDTWEE